MLRDYAQGIYDREQTNLTALVTYGVTAATQTALQAAITTFVTFIPKPRLSINEKNQSTVHLANYFDSADGAISNFDTIIEIVKISHANFYNGYKTARMIVETGIGSLAVKRLIADTTTGEPLKGAKLSFSPNGHDEALKAADNGGNTNKSEVMLTKRTADKGGFNIKSLPEGVYSATISKNGYKDQVETVAVTQGELSDLNIRLSKN